MSDATKFEFSSVVWEGYRNKLKNNVFKLIPLREDSGHWEKHLQTIQIELLGLSKEFQSINLISIIAKLAELHVLEFAYYRKTVFEILTLIDQTVDPSKLGEGESNERNLHN